jgi:Protein of unknown function (DUF2934)
MAKQKTEAEPVAASGAALAMVAILEEPVEEAAPALSSPEHEQIAQLAYSYWQARGCPDGSAEEDWFRAEADLQNGAGRAD